MRLLIDMNLSPVWVSYLSGQGIESVHWSAVGAANAPDAEVMEWAREHGCVVSDREFEFCLFDYRMGRGKERHTHALTSISSTLSDHRVSGCESRQPD
ncbi:MAG: DUF5615 family PIN-like protein [Verrucomicrobia bacterium]|nr:DUF5615 family PIN-like protein [Verrucomicrobiota bacterium]